VQSEECVAHREAERLQPDAEGARLPGHGRGGPGHAGRGVISGGDEGSREARGRAKDEGDGVGRRGGTGWRQQPLTEALDARLGRLGLCGHEEQRGSLVRGQGRRPGHCGRVGRGASGESSRGAVRDPLR